MDALEAMQSALNLPWHVRGGFRFHRNSHITTWEQTRDQVSINVVLYSLSWYRQDNV
jgi:hypothetical protein